MWLLVTIVRNWRHPFTAALVGLGLVLWAVILVTTFGDITCMSERMEPGDVCATTARHSGEVLSTETYEEMRADQQRWTPILVPAFIVVGVPLAAIGFVSAHRSGVLWRRSGKRKPGGDRGVETSAYAAQVARAAAMPRVPSPPPPPPPPASIHHDA